MKPRIDETVQNLLNNFESAVDKAPDVDVKKLFGSYTMDTIVQVKFYAFTYCFATLIFTLTFFLQVAFGTRIDSLNDPNNPVILNAQNVFSTDITVKIFVQMLFLLAFPKLAKTFGIRFRGLTVDFFKNFSEDIIKKAKEELKKSKKG